MKPLNPIMAVLVIASVGASPLRTHAADGATAPAAAAEDKNPLNAMSRILSENPTARADAGKRMEEFLLDPDGGGKSFVKAGVDRKALGAVAREWSEQSPVGSVAVLYFVVGPGRSVPGWAQKDSVLSKTFASGMKWEGRLRDSLAKWTGQSQIDKTQEKTQVVAFLTEAASKAADVFADQRTKKEIDDSILANNTSGPVAPDTTRSPGSRLNGAMRQYTLDDLYGPPAAVVKDVSGPNDPNSRKISMKIYTKRMPDGTTRNEIGIFDITDTNDIFGQRFPIDSGKQSFTLDDRTPGHKKYELTFGATDDKGNRTIKFARPGDGGVPLETDVAALFIARADQAERMGNIVTVGGQEFYTLPQGGAKGALALFPKALVDARGTGDARDLIPSLFAEVGIRGPDGRSENVLPGPKGGPHLGKVGDTEYHLVFNKALGLWEVKEGGGDLPPPPAAPATGGNGSTAGGGTGGNTGGTPTTGGSVPLADLETLTIREFEAEKGSCKKNPDDIKYLAPDLKGQYGILICENPVEGQSQTILVPKSADALDQRFRYRNVKGLVLKRARFFDHFLVLVFDKQVQYLDLLKFEKDAAGTASFAMSGFIADKNATKFVDVGAFVDALRNYMDLKGEDAGAIAAVPGNVAKVLGGKAYHLGGGMAGTPPVFVVHAMSGGRVYNLWPTIIMPDNETVPKPNPYTDLVGPSNAMGGDVSSENKKFEPSFETAEKRTAVLIGTEQAAEDNDVALYVTKDPINRDTDAEKKYYLMFRYRSPDPEKVAIFRHKQIEVFNKDNPYPGDGVQLSGLVKAGSVVSSRGAAGYKFVSGSKKEKGVFVLLQNKQVSGTNAQNPAANCAGPLIWWGLDRAAALKVCQDEKF